MNVQSYTVLHYGADYLSYALRSVYHFVDKLHIVYSPHPSHGHHSDALCPEGRDLLLDTAYEYDPLNKVTWHDVSHREEGRHRDAAVDICQRHGAELVLVVDADEVWPEETLAGVLSHVWDSTHDRRNWLINFTTLWRSFDWVVRDDLWPVRLIDLRHGDGTAYVPRELGPIYHFGYAVRDQIMSYKWECHGHKGELRPGWLDTKWAAWPPPPDCHPTNDRDFWRPEPFDRTALPPLMRGHPFWGLEKIE